MADKNIKVTNEVSIKRALRDTLKQPLHTIREICLTNDAPREKLKAILITCDKVLKAIDNIDTKE